MLEQNLLRPFILIEVSTTPILDPITTLTLQVRDSQRSKRLLIINLNQAVHSLSHSQEARIPNKVGRTSQRITPQAAKTLLSPRPNKERVFKRKIILRISNDKLRLPVGGRLVHFHKQWNTSFLRRCIKRGLTWKWKSRPPPFQAESSFH